MVARWIEVAGGPVGEVLLEPFADVAAWTARRPNNQASSDLSIAIGTRQRLAGRPTATIEASADAAGHRLDRAGPPRDLSATEDLELWVRGDRAADGSPERPFYAEVRLGLRRATRRLGREPLEPGGAGAPAGAVGARAARPRRPAARRAGGGVDRADHGPRRGLATRSRRHPGVPARAAERRRRRPARAPGRTHRRRRDAGRRHVRPHCDRRGPAGAAASPTSRSGR